MYVCLATITRQKMRVRLPSCLSPLLRSISFSYQRKAKEGRQEQQLESRSLSLLLTSGSRTLAAGTRLRLHLLSDSLSPSRTRRLRTRAAVVEERKRDGHLSAATTEADTEKDAHSLPQESVARFSLVHSVVRLRSPLLLTLSRESLAAAVGALDVAIITATHAASVLLP